MDATTLRVEYVYTVRCCHDFEDDCNLAAINRAERTVERWRRRVTMFNPSPGISWKRNKVSEGFLSGGFQSTGMPADRRQTQFPADVTVSVSWQLHYLLHQSAILLPFASSMQQQQQQQQQLAKPGGRKRKKSGRKGREKPAQRWKRVKDGGWRSERTEQGRRKWFH